MSGLLLCFQYTYRLRRWSKISSPRDAVVKENLTVLATVRVVQVIQPAARVVPAVQAALAPPVITESKKTF